jgi:L-lactate dehydrogenase (cytochrome)
VNQFLELLYRQARADIRALPSRAPWCISSAARVERCCNVAELRDLAARAVPRAVFDYVDGAAADELTARRNVEEFERLTLWPRVLDDVSDIDLATTVLGQRVALPILGAPTGLTGLTHHRGEVGIARAVHSAGSVYILSAAASYTIEEVSRDAPGPTWFQLYMWRDRGVVRDLLTRAREAGYRALVLTVDVPYAGQRERDVRNRFGIPPRVTARSLADGVRRPRWSSSFVRRPRMMIANAAGRGGGPSDAPSLTDYIASQWDPSLSWQDLTWLREIWAGKLAVKGILRPADANQAVRLGADGVVVSNHGGRQLDRAPASVRALPAIVDALGGSAEVYLDGGVRRGSDVATALALGARACLVGRALVYGLGAGGDAGAARAMTILTRELKLTMALAGRRSVDRLDRSWLHAGAAASPSDSTSSAAGADSSSASHG